jgi:hypothetical protein
VRVGHIWKAGAIDMAVRVKLSLTPRIPAPAPVPDVIALVNTGYTAGRRELIIPEALALRLTWFPPSAAAIVETYESPAGPFQIHRLPEAVEVAIVGANRTGPTTSADAVIVAHEVEVLLSDALIGPLGLALIDATAGQWAFRDELHIVRPSEPAQLWT